jgi:hypothetical protein
MRLTLAITASLTLLSAQPKISDKPETPFKLATFEADGKLQIGMVFGSRVVDIARANTYVQQKAHLATVTLPNEMRALIEQYDTTSKRLYQIANYLKGETAGLPFAYDFAKVSVKAPIKYPWNLLNLAANYKAHAEGMAVAGGTAVAASPAAWSRCFPARTGSMARALIAALRSVP